MINEACRIRLDIDITDCLNTYGFKQVINAYIMKRIMVCEHCNRKRESADRFCGEDGLHNFKPIFVVFHSLSANTPNEALEKITERLKNDTH